MRGRDRSLHWNFGFQVSRRQIKLGHALTWLSLTTYAWEDYDSICGAFYNGLLLLQEAEVERE